VALRRRVDTTRAQQFGNELSDGFEHLRSAAVIAAERAAEAVAPRVDTAREVLAPRVEAAREALAPRVGAARDVVGPQFERARDAASRSWGTTVAAVAPVVTAAVESAHRATEEARKEADKQLSRAERRTRKARRNAKAKAREAARVVRREQPKRRKWPWVLGAIGLAAAGVAIGTAVSRRSTPRWEDYEAEQEFAAGGLAGRTDSVAGTVRDKAGAAASAVKDKAAVVKDKAAEKAAEVKDRLTPSENGKDEPKDEAEQVESPEKTKSTPARRTGGGTTKS
jgi:ElaB/YqjD/DUF883 family membrane-anchored ribosome-binding protein